jgi:hypothetical protein
VTPVTLFAELLASARSSVVHLEMRDQYMLDDPDLKAWQAGIRPDPRTERHGGATGSICRPRQRHAECGSAVCES